MNSDKLLRRLRHLTLYTPLLYDIVYFPEAKPVNFREAKQKTAEQKQPKIIEDPYANTPVHVLQRCNAATTLDPSLGDTPLGGCEARGKLESVTVKIGQQWRPGTDPSTSQWPNNVTGMRHC